MSQSQNPLTGKMAGSMANFITTVHRGKNIIKSKAFNPRDANSEAQQAQRSSFKLVVEEYNSLGGIVEMSFPECEESVMPYNLFVKENLKAVDKSADVLKLDYTKLKVACGTLPAPLVAEAKLTETGVTVTYLNKKRIPKIKESDRICLLVKTSEGELYFEEVIRGESATGTISTTMEQSTLALITYAYLFVLSEDGSKASNSVFLNLQ